MHLRHASLIVYCLFFALSGCVTSQPKANPDATPNDQIDAGYGDVDKDDYVGSAVVVAGDDAQAAHPTSVADMLRGRAAGVQVTELPGGGIRVRIRGNRSFNGNNDPLYVVDGMVVQTTDGALHEVHPRDIQTITVLKDASATAIYGSRGANGVILIKTKRGT